MSAVFSYLSVSSGGLSEVELEDVLSNNDDVLNGVKQFDILNMCGVCIYLSFMLSISLYSFHFA